MLKINYGKNGTAYSDFEVTEVIDDFVGKCNYKEQDYEFDVTNENLIYAVRVAIVNGKLDPQYVILSFDEGTIMFDESAKPINGKYPSTYTLDAMFEIIRAGKPQK